MLFLLIVIRFFVLGVMIISIFFFNMVISFGVRDFLWDFVIFLFVNLVNNFWKFGLEMGEIFFFM